VKECCESKWLWGVRALARDGVVDRKVDVTGVMWLMQGAGSQQHCSTDCYHIQHGHDTDDSVSE
jgi:hypothetical protein